jgi:chromosome segregation ATPase
VIEGDVAVSKHFVDVFALCRSRKHFADVFKVFVPRGNGCIQMHTAESGDIENAREEDPAETPADTEQLTEAQGNRVASFKGVQVKVSFTGGVKGEQFFMHQLSGGQQAVVALAYLRSCGSLRRSIAEQMEGEAGAGGSREAQGGGGGEFPARPLGYC